MRNPFSRRLSVDFIRVPTEPSGAQLVERFLAGDPVELINHHLRQQSALKPEDRNIELIDALLEIRNVLTVPVIPGRTT